MIRFNRPLVMESSETYLHDVLTSDYTGADGKYCQLCAEWMEKQFESPKVMLTSSCTAALDMSALLAKIQPGDEVIVPSYTFSTTASSFALRNASLVFVDIRPDTMNIDETLIEEAITSKTKVICVVHYAGVSCEMDTIMALARKYNLFVVEDAAQGVMSKYKGQYLGTIGDIGCYSFHETKNYNMGEGGAILVNNPSLIDDAESIRDCGTDKKDFRTGKVSQYSWVAVGSSYLPSELQAAYLYSQLEEAEKINDRRLAIWERYHHQLQGLKEKGLIDLPVIPEGCEHNAHMFFIKVQDKDERAALMTYLKAQGISAVSHYVPLHSAKAGLQFGRFNGIDRYTTRDSQRILRLPMYYGLNDEEVDEVVKQINLFYSSK